MREARTKIRLIKPEDMDMDEYLVRSKRFFFFLNVEYIFCCLKVWSQNDFYTLLRRLILVFNRDALIKNDSKDIYNVTKIMFQINAVLMN